MNKSINEIMMEYRDELIEAGVEAYKDARENKHMAFTVEIDSNGKINTWGKAAGENSYHVSEIPEVEIFKVFEFCFQYESYSSEEEEPLFIELMKKSGREEELEELERLAEEEDETFFAMVIDSGKYEDELKKVDDELLDFEVSDYAPEYIENLLDTMLEEDD